MVEYVLEKDEAEKLLRYGKNRGWDSQLVWEDPEKFIDKTPKIDFGREAFNELKQKLKEKVPLDPLWMDVDCSGKVTNHEGRHRAFAALCLGIEKVPIIVFNKCKVK